MSAADADVIVIGGGPSGVAAAVELRRRGVPRVILLDRESRLGGATRHCSHSPFGMREFGRMYFGAAYGRRLELEAQRAGVEVRTRRSVVQLDDRGSIVVASPRGVESLSARRIMVATGAREKPRSARLISGDRPIGVLTTGSLQSHVAFHGLLPFRRPVIVGSELVSLSAVVTCLAHGARPVAILEPRAHALARAPLTWFPPMMGIPFLRNVEIVEIVGRQRVEAVTIREAGRLETLACDGVLLSGEFTPESSLFLLSSIGIDPGSAGPCVDQDGRSLDPCYFAGGNLLRAIETGGWSYREGRAVGAALAADLERDRDAGPPVAVTFDDPVKLVVPNLLRPGTGKPAAFSQFQLRFLRRARGRLSLELEGREVWHGSGTWMPERRVLAPLPAHAPLARHVHFRFREQT